MTRSNSLIRSPPQPVHAALVRLGRDLKLARQRRGWTVQQLADRLGTGVRAVSDAERGKPSTSIVTWAGMLWAFGLISQLDAVADPSRDEEGLQLAALRTPLRVRPSKGLNDDF